MRRSWLRVGVPVAAAMLLTVWIGAGLVSAQGKPVRINGAIDKLAQGKSLAGAIMYDFSLYAAAQFASSDLDFMIIDMEHRGLDFERLETFLLGTTNKAEIAKQGNLQVRVPPIVRIPTYGRAPNEAIVKQVLDMGAFGIMFPAIENKAAGARGGVGRALSAAERLEVSQPGRTARQRQHAGGVVLGIVAGPSTRCALMSGRQIRTASCCCSCRSRPWKACRTSTRFCRCPASACCSSGPNDLSWSLGVPQGVARTRRGRAARARCVQGEKHPGRDYGDRGGRRRARLKQGFRIASLPSGGLEAADGCDAEARADSDRQ